MVPIQTRAKRLVQSRLVPPPFLSPQFSSHAFAFLAFARSPLALCISENAVQQTQKVFPSSDTAYSRLPPFHHTLPQRPQKATPQSEQRASLSQ